MIEVSVLPLELEGLDDVLNTVIVHVNDDDNDELDDDIHLQMNVVDVDDVRLINDIIVQSVPDVRDTKCDDEAELDDTIDDKTDVLLIDIIEENDEDDDATELTVQRDDEEVVDDI